MSLNYIIHNVTNQVIINLLCLAIFLSIKINAFYTTLRLISFYNYIFQYTSKDYSQYIFHVK